MSIFLMLLSACGWLTLGVFTQNLGKGTVSMNVVSTVCCFATLLHMVAWGLAHKSKEDKR